MSLFVIYCLWVSAMTLALIFPVSRLIWVVSVRRLQKRLKKQLNEQELVAQKQRSYFIGFFVSLIFSALFNFRQLGL